MKKFCQNSVVQFSVNLRKKKPVVIKKTKIPSLKLALRVKGECGSEMKIEIWLESTATTGSNDKTNLITHNYKRNIFWEGQAKFYLPEVESLRATVAVMLRNHATSSMNVLFPKQHKSFTNILFQFASKKEKQWIFSSRCDKTW